MKKYLGSGCSLREIHYTYRVGRKTASGIIRNVCKKIWQLMVEEYISRPNEEQLRTVVKDFEKRTYFPHCLGAVDGKHIRLVKSPGSASLCYNYKNFFSLILMAVTDSNYRFIYIDVGSYGKDADPTIFENSSLWRSLENNTLEIPASEHIPGIPDMQIPYTFVLIDFYF
ncbi:hypothetical protein NQ314_004679 [Rhamnusium bicolor]|uniref:DDE Tnp4 domain-containing protein n=1 Tax=Rhamnusium bicolor TaxID=1586634 RepID=A0AAV8ZIT1_9CUCU|nr:hypothetical protein NQ314_004679 [Rhamnusium bicolor]